MGRARPRHVNAAEEMTAELFRLGRYNRFPDPLRELGRTSLVYERTPPRPPFSDFVAWEALQRRALAGFSISEYLERFGVMIFMMSRGWGVPDEDGAIETPIVRVKEWLERSVLGTE